MNTTEQNKEQSQAICTILSSWAEEISRLEKTLDEFNSFRETEFWPRIALEAQTLLINRYASMQSYMDTLIGFNKLALNRGTNRFGFTPHFES